MERIIIEGGVPLHGEVAVSGAKNAALPILFASLLCPGVTTIRRIPRVWDVGTTCKLLTVFGADVQRTDDVAQVDATNLHTFKAPYELVKTMRASVLALAPLLARFGQAKVSLPGGCAIGARPVDQHIKALEALGVDIEIHHGYIAARLRGERMKGGLIDFDITTVGGTEQALMAAVLADGVTVIENAAQEPEVQDLAHFLIAMGARITGVGESTIEVEGVTALHSAAHEVIPDRIEAGTYMTAAAITDGDVTIDGIIENHQRPLLQVLAAAGVRMEPAGPGCIRVRRMGALQPVDVATAPYPGFPTDMQAQIMAMLTLARGVSRITETIFENRFMHVMELLRMGAQIDLDGSTAYISGVDHLQGADVMSTDLRASASLVVAGLVAEGRTVVDRVYHLNRGYDRLVEKLMGLGALVRSEAG